jgi:hypothetical protein
VTSRALAVLTVADKESRPYAELARLEAGDPSWPKPVRTHYLAHPRDARYRELADRIIADAAVTGVPADKVKSPLVQAFLFMNWIHKNTTYSLRPGNGHLPDPVAEFLFGNRKGYCQHVASAMTYLLRSRGIPARVALGFCVPEKRRGQGTSVMVQTTDGHAWCEMYLKGAGWVPLDVSPEQSEEPPPSDPSPELVHHLREKFSNPKEDENPDEDPAQQGWDWRWFFRWILPRALGLLADLLALLYAVKMWRRLAPHLASPQALYRVCYRATLDRLAEVGLTRRFGETCEEFAQRLTRLVPELAELTAGHVRRAVAGQDTFSAAQWHQLHEQVRDRIIEVFARWRRWLGVLNPVSWMFAR